jgi:hypothetical protein
MQHTERSYKTTKEHLYALKFSKSDAIQSDSEKKVRTFQLIRAMRLGNLFKNKVLISFRDSQDRLMNINTTIWGVTQKSVILKKGVYIPIHSIVSVE